MSNLINKRNMELISLMGLQAFIEQVQNEKHQLNATDMVMAMSSLAMIGKINNIKPEEIHEELKKIVTDYCCHIFFLSLCGCC